jgi:O-acetyl-ADP-ribose deacetylase (regulator of RNase III)
MNIEYLKGDITKPILEKGLNVIAHVCNDIGVMGAGVAKAIRNEYPNVYSAYQAWIRKSEHDVYNVVEQSLPKQGGIQVIKINDSLVVANLIAQSGIGNFFELQPARHEALHEALIRLREYIGVVDTTIHMPRILCGLAGSSWNRVEPIIQCVFNGDEHVKIKVYDL